MPEIPPQQNPQPTNIQSPTAANPDKSRWKNVLLITLIGTTLIFAGAAAYYYFGLDKTTPTPETKPPKTTTTSAKKTTTTETKDETAGWKTYTNTYKNKSFTFKYPKDWAVSTETYSMGIDYLVKKGGNTIQFWSIRPRGASISGPAEVINQKYTWSVINVDFDGRMIKSNELTSKEGGNWEIFPQGVSNLTFAFDITSSTVPSNDERSTMLIITSTFKFLD